MLQLREVRETDYEAVGLFLRDEDLAELALTQVDRDPVAILRDSVAVSEEAWTGEVDGLPVFIGGVSRNLEEDLEWGCPWLLCTPNVDRCGMELVRTVRLHIQKWLPQFAFLLQMVDGRHVRMRRLLELCGFTEHSTFQLEGQTFHSLARTNPCVTP